ncbi:hypothetical protein C0Q70_09740 [Pomacea canaliculata]|uniref:Uncharacterized protein n=1 Tax=Pomacea canaliculata TaxID=400727 RepID=A0A2T7PAM3_POMCA|nr:hypothetical protein C0Q70_09740 [Pomacea canaliculata]
MRLVTCRPRGYGELSASLRQRHVVGANGKDVDHVHPRRPKAVHVTDKRWSRGAETKVCGCSTLNSPVLVRQEQSIAIRTCLQDKAHYSIRDSAKGPGSGAGYRG